MTTDTVASALRIGMVDNARFPRGPVTVLTRMKLTTFLHSLLSTKKFVGNPLSKGCWSAPARPLRSRPFAVDVFGREGF